MSLTCKMCLHTCTIDEVHYFLPSKKIPFLTLKLTYKYNPRHLYQPRVMIHFPSSPPLAALAIFSWQHCDRFNRMQPNDSCNQSECVLQINVFCTCRTNLNRKWACVTFAMSDCQKDQTNFGEHI